MPEELRHRDGIDALPRPPRLTASSIAVGPRLSYAAGLAARLGEGDDRVGVDEGDSIIVRPAEAGLTV